MQAEKDFLTAEQAVLGSILIDSRVTPVATDSLTPEDFAVEQHRDMFACICAMQLEGAAIDPVTVLHRMESDGVQQSDSRQYVLQLMNITPTAANIARYVSIVKEHADRRRLSGVCSGILDRIAEGSAPASELISKLSQDAQAIVEGSVNGRCISSGDAMKLFFDGLEARENGVKNVVSSGYHNLDKKLGGGFLRGGLYIIAARPGMGKTTLALNICDRIRGGVLFVSLEMSTEQVTAKRLSCRTGIPAHRLLMGDTFTDDEYTKLAQASSDLSQTGVVVNKKIGASVAEIAAMARTVDHLSAVIVDYLGLIRPEGKRGSLYEAATEISGALKRLAISLNVPVIALCQLNRAAETRPNKQPLLSDLRDSGSIEQDADGVLLLYRPDYYSEEKKEYWQSSPVQCSVAKNRHAGTGTVDFDCYLAMSRVVEIGA